MDPLQLRADFDHAQALANAKELAAAIRDLKDAATETGRSQNALATSTEQASKAGQAAGNTYNQLNAELRISNSQTLKLTENVKNVSNETYKYTTNIKNVYGATKDTSSATSGLVSQVQNLVGAYMGMQTVIKLFDGILERMKAMSDATKEMGGLAFDDDKAMMSLANRTGLGGELGVAHMRKLRSQIVAESGATPQTAAETMTAAMDAGIDLDSASGRAMAREGAKFGQRRGLDRSGLTQFFRGARLQGATDANSLNTIIAKTEATAQAGGMDLPELLQNQDQILSEARNAGLDQDYAMSIYAALIGETGSQRRARGAMNALIQSVSSENKKATGFFAHQAATMGVTKVTGPTDADLEGILSQSKEGRGILADRQKLVEMDAKQKVHMDHLRHGPHGLADLNAAEIQYADQTSNERQKIDLAMADLRAKELARRELEAYSKIGATDRIERVIRPTLGSMSLSDYQANSGVSLQDQDVQGDLGNPQFTRRQREALKDRRGANYFNAESKNQDYFNSDLGQANAAIGKAQLNALNDAARRGDYIHVLEQKVKSKYQQDVANGEFVPQSPFNSKKGFFEQAGENIHYSEGQQIANETINEFGNDLQKFIADNAGSPEAAAASGLLNELRGQEKNPMNFFSDNAAGNIYWLAGDFGALKKQAANRDQLQRMRPASSGGSFGPSAPTTRPTTQPSPQASAIHYHTHIGNYWAGGDDDFEDLPGRLERDS